jgi:hypothetical protein
MKITKSQLKQLVMEELAENMPDLAEEGQVEEGRFGRSKEPAYLKRAREEEEDKLYGKPKGDEDTIRRDPHGKRSREERSEKDAKNEGRITKSALNAIIAEEYNKLAKEARGYYGGGRSYGEPGDMGSDREAIAADRRQDAMAASDREHAATMSKWYRNLTPEQHKALVSAAAKDQTVAAIWGRTRLGLPLDGKQDQILKQAVGMK